MGYIFGSLFNSKSNLPILGRDPQVLIPAGTFVIAIVFKTTVTQNVIADYVLAGNGVFNDLLVQDVDYEVVINKKFEIDTTLYIAGDLTPATPVNVEIYKM